MDEGHKKTLIREARAVVISVIVVPAILAWLQVSPPVIVGVGLSLLVVLSAWETGYLVPARWSSDGKVTDGKLRASVGVIVLCGLIGGGYVASHWPTRFLKSESPPSEKAAPLAAPVISRLDHFVLQCDVPPLPPSKTPLDSLWDLRDYKDKLDIYGDAIGVTFTMVTIRGGVRIEIDASSEQAKQRMPLTVLGVTKFILEIRRIDNVDLVSIFTNMPPQYWIYGVLTPIPTAPDSILLVQFIEHFLGIKSGACKII